MSIGVRPDLTVNGTPHVDAPRAAGDPDVAAVDLVEDPTRSRQAEVEVRWRAGLVAVLVLGAALTAALLVPHAPTGPGTVVAVGGGFATVMVADDRGIDAGDTVTLADTSGATSAATVDASATDPATEQHALTLEVHDLGALELDGSPIVTVTMPARSLARSVVGR